MSIQLTLLSKFKAKESSALGLKSQRFQSQMPHNVLVGHDIVSREHIVVGSTAAPVFWRTEYCDSKVPCPSSSPPVILRSTILSGKFMVTELVET